MKLQREQIKLVTFSDEEQKSCRKNSSKPKFDPNKPYEELPSLEELENAGKQAAFYDKIKDKYDIGTLPEFLKALSSSENRNALYDQLVSDGFNLGTFDQFETKLGFVSMELLIASKNEIIKYHSRLAYLNKWINIYNEAISYINVMDSNELSRLFVKLTLFILAFLYPFRFLVTAIMWALRTLWSK